MINFLGIKFEPENMTTEELADLLEKIRKLRQNLKFQFFIRKQDKPDLAPKNKVINFFGLKLEPKNMSIKELQDILEKTRQLQLAIHAPLLVKQNANPVLEAIIKKSEQKKI